jgi:hypothetical protein
VSSSETLRDMLFEYLDSVFILGYHRRCAKDMYTSCLIIIRIKKRHHFRRFKSRFLREGLDSRCVRIRSRCNNLTVMELDAVSSEFSISWSLWFVHFDSLEMCFFAFFLAYWIELGLYCNIFLIMGSVVLFQVSLVCLRFFYSKCISLFVSFLGCVMGLYALQWLFDAEWDESMVVYDEPA